MKDATYWVEKFKSKEVSLVEYYIELDKKVQKINPEVNALVEWNSEEILEAAKCFTLNDNQPFSGMPLPLKMLGQDRAGWKSTYGSRLFSEVRSSGTSNFTKKLEDIGFLPSGQTNVPELGFKNITDSRLYGPARNPWNLDHSPGGSSGGAASVVSSGLFPIAGASDGGGSIRIPASFNGLVGLKPTRGSMPNGPGGWRAWSGAATDFALTISMRDTEKLFYTLRGNVSAAPYHPPVEAWQSHTINQPLKIAYMIDSPIHSAVSDDAKLALKKSITDLEQMGHELTEIAFPLDGISLIESYYLMNGVETSALFDDIQKKMQRNITIDDVELITWGIYQYGEKVPAKNYIQAISLWDHAAAKMEELFSKYDLFITPTTAHPAPKIGEDLQNNNIREGLRHAENLNEYELTELIYQTCEKMFTLTPYTHLANLTGQPAISLPTYITKDGLPLGIQFMASKGREDLLFYIGKQMEEQQLFKMPTVYEDK